MKRYISPPFLSTSFSESAKGAQRRLSGILDSRKKRAGAFIIIIILVLAVGVGMLYHCPNVSADIEAAVSDAIIANINCPDRTELRVEGHVILGTDKLVDSAGREEIKVYAIAAKMGYSFIDDKFAITYGSWDVATTVTLRRGENGKLEAVSVEEPKYEGELLDASIAEMFPTRIYFKQALVKEHCRPKMKRQMQSQIQEYLESIGRSDAVVLDTFI